MTEAETKPETVEKSAELVDTAKQREACDTIVAGIRRLTGRMLQDYWGVGKLINEVVAAQETEEGQKKYGENAIKYISGQTKHSVAELYRMNTVFQSYTEDQIAKLTDTGIGITNVVEAAKIVDGKERMKLLLNAAEEKTTVKEFKQVIDEAAASKENQKALKEERGEEKAGVKSRPGTGRSGSPITPVKQVGALGEKIASAFKNALIGLKEFDAETDKQGQNMVDAAEFAAGVLVDVLQNAVGFAEVVEEYLAVNQGDGRRRRSQTSRKDDYAAVVGALQDFLKGYDKTLAAGEKARKEMEEAEAEEAEKAKAEKEKAKEAIREKAAAKAKKKTEKPAKAEKEEKPAKAEKPSKDDAEAARLEARLAALRARAKAKK